MFHNKCKKIIKGLNKYIIWNVPNTRKPQHGKQSQFYNCLFNNVSDFIIIAAFYLFICLKGNMTHYLGYFNIMATGPVYNPICPSTNHIDCNWSTIVRMANWWTFPQTFTQSIRMQTNDNMPEPRGEKMSRCSHNAHVITSRSSSPTSCTDTGSHISTHCLHIIYHCISSLFPASFITHILGATICLRHIHIHRNTTYITTLASCYDMYNDTWVMVRYVSRYKT